MNEWGAMAFALIGFLGFAAFIFFAGNTTAPTWEIHFAESSPGYSNELNVVTATGELKFHAAFAHSYCGYDQNLFDPSVEIRGNVIRISLLHPPEGTPICKCIFTTAVEGHVWGLRSGEYSVEMGWRSRDGKFKKIKAVTVRVP